MRNFICFCSFALLIAFFGGCAKEPGIQRVIYKEVKIPVKCGLLVPFKPINDGSFKAHRELMKYYLQCENIAKFCTNYKGE